MDNTYNKGVICKHAILLQNNRQAEKKTDLQNELFAEKVDKQKQKQKNSFSSFTLQLFPYVYGKYCLKYC